MNGYVEIPPELPQPGDIILIEYDYGVEVWRLHPAAIDPMDVQLVQTRKGRRVDSWPCGRSALKNHLTADPTRRRLLRRVSR